MRLMVWFYVRRRWMVPLVFCFLAVFAVVLNVAVGNDHL